jgi:hypothetical protein
LPAENAEEDQVRDSALHPRAVRSQVLAFYWPL